MSCSLAYSSTTDLAIGFLALYGFANDYDAAIVVNTLCAEATLWPTPS